MMRKEVDDDEEVHLAGGNTSRKRENEAANRAKHS
jgi:hypothetical protein